MTVHGRGYGVGCFPSAWAFAAWTVALGLVFFYNLLAVRSMSSTSCVMPLLGIGRIPVRNAFSRDVEYRPAVHAGREGGVQMVRGLRLWSCWALVLLQFVDGARSAHLVVGTYLSVSRAIASSVALSCVVGLHRRLRG